MLKAKGKTDLQENKGEIPINWEKRFDDFLRSGKIEEKYYFNISAFSLLKNKEHIISEVEKIHSDETPIIVFTEIDGNEKFLMWIEKEIK